MVQPGEVLAQLENVTRIEIIDTTGRAFTRYYAPAGAEVHLQDDGRTLKVFASKPKDDD